MKFSEGMMVGSRDSSEPIWVKLPIYVLIKKKKKKIAFKMWMLLVGNWYLNVRWILAEAVRMLEEERACRWWWCILHGCTRGSVKWITVRKMLCNGHGEKLAGTYRTRQHCPCPPLRTFCFSCYFSSLWSLLSPCATSSPANR